jgi:hypothetical protein
MSNQATNQEREELLAQIAALEEQQKALKAKNNAILSEERKLFRLAVSSKGGISVYGFGRFPVTLYPDQMANLLSHASEIIQFMNANKAKTDGIAKERREAKAAAVQAPKVASPAEVLKQLVLSLQK